ncbi:MAG: HAD superfamily hydrolase (TIGR01509 family) [Gammaproteobacteria bacterium]|jgi:HAD superfamily hydrolase (TIGR01509 family)
MSIEWITFDLDDTLWAVEPVIVRAEEQFYLWLSRHCPRVTEQFDRAQLMAHRREFSNQFPEQRHDLTAMRKLWIAHVFELFDYRELSTDDAFRFFWEHRNEVELFDEVVPAMERLRTQYRLGVITNGNACVQQIGIDHWFEFVVSSEAAGHSKPAPQIFHKALGYTGVEPSKIVHVGDDPTNDVLGAAAIGMRTVWYNPDSSPWPEAHRPGKAPDQTINSMSQIHDALQRITG